MILVAVALLLAVLAPWSTLEATHADDHRYVVLGYRPLDRQSPVVGARAKVIREKTGYAYKALTDRDGFDIAVVHLRDEDNGDMLHVTGRPARALSSAISSATSCSRRPLAEPDHPLPRPPRSGWQTAGRLRQQPGATVGGCGMDPTGGLRDTDHMMQGMSGRRDDEEGRIRQAIEQRVHAVERRVG